MTKILFIINPVSGIHQEKKERLLELIPFIFSGDNYQISIHYSQGSGDAFAAASLEVARQIDIVVAVGGDGTVNEIARALVHTNTRLGIIPLGSGNGLAHFLHIPFRLEDALEVIRNENAIRIDTLLLNDTLAVSIAGLGFDARVAREYARFRRRGFLTYMKVAVKEYFTYRQRKYRIVSEHFSITEKALLVSIANSNQFGYNTTIAPHASVTDGLADITIVKKIPFHTLFFTGLLLFTRKIDRSRYVNTYQCSDFTIKRKRGRYVNIDGEPVEMPKTIHVRVQPKSLNILVP